MRKKLFIGFPKEFKGETFFVVFFVKCSVVFYLQMFLSNKIYPVNSGNRVANVLEEKGCHLCLPSVFCGCLIEFACRFP